MTVFRNGRWCLGLAALASPALVGAQTIDGQNIPGDFASGSLLATQRFQTAWGDDIDGSQFGFGSELDQMFASSDSTYLYLGITGNLENNGNGLVIFIDSDGPASGAAQLFVRDVFGELAPGLRDTNAPTGQVFGRPRYFASNPLDFCRGFDGVTFDPGFAPDFALGFSGGSPLGSQTRNYYLVNWTTLDPVSSGLNHTNEVAGLMTAGDATASGPAGTLGSFLATSALGIKGAFDNSNNDGVEGGNLVSTLAGTATTGAEFAIPLSLLGVGPGDSVCVFAIIVGSNGYQSNQYLPTDSAATDMGSIACTPTDWNNLTGNQYACYTIPGGNPCPCPGDVNNDGIRDINDLGLFLAAFGLPATNCADIDGNGIVDISDLSLFLAGFGVPCP